jgi:hypothetical protein
MAGGSKQALIWRARWLARKLDWLSLTGIGLALLALALYVYGVKPVESRLPVLEERLAALEVRADGRPRNAATTRPGEQLAAFYDRLADARDAPEIAGRLHAHARAAGLNLEHGEYRPLSDASGKLLRYQIVLPLTGSYPQVRRFLGDALRDMPGLALEAIRFKRDEGNSGQLQTELRFTAFLRSRS